MKPLHRNLLVLAVLVVGVVGALVYREHRLATRDEDYLKRGMHCLLLADDVPRTQIRARLATVQQQATGDARWPVLCARAFAMAAQRTGPNRSPIEPAALRTAVTAIESGNLDAIATAIEPFAQ